MATKKFEETGDVHYHVSLLEYLDLSQLNCLNESPNQPFKPIMASKARNASDSYLLSDADEQLLLNIPFNQAVRIRSILIQSKDAERAPKKIKLFTNRPNAGFEDVEDAEEPAVAQIITLSESDVASGKQIALRYVRFQTINSLHIFVASNQGDASETRIDALDVFGVPVETTKDLSNLRKQED